MICSFAKETKFLTYSLLAICCLFLFLAPRSNRALKAKRSADLCTPGEAARILIANCPGAHLLGSILHCFDRGKIYITTTVPLPRAYFRIRLVGPKICLLHATRISDYVYEVPYGGLIPGSYSFECILMYEDFNEGDLSSNMPISFSSINEPYIFEVGKSKIKRRTIVVSKNELNSLEGEWIVNDTEVMTYLRLTRTQRNDSWPEGHPLIHSPLPDVENIRKLYFQSKQNKFDFIFSHKNHSDLSCLLDLDVCFWGDSQMRYLHNSAVGLIKSTEIDVGMLNSNPHAILVGNDRFHYFEKTYSGFQEDMEGLLSSSTCQVVVVNFGQWPVGWPEGYPWSFVRYQVYAEADIAYLSQMQKEYPTVKFFWMSTNAHGYVDSILNGGEWRIDPVLEKLNSIVDRLTKKYSVEFINTYEIAKVLADLSFDWSHYRGAVGWAQGNYFLNVLHRVVCESAADSNKQ